MAGFLEMKREESKYQSYYLKKIKKLSNQDAFSYILDVNNNINDTISTELKAPQEIILGIHLGKKNKPLCAFVKHLT